MVGAATAKVREPKHAHYHSIYANLMLILESLLQTFPSRAVRQRRCHLQENANSLVIIMF